MNGDSPYHAYRGEGVMEEKQSTSSFFGIPMDQLERERIEYDKHILENAAPGILNSLSKDDRKRSRSSKHYNVHFDGDRVTLTKSEDGLSFNEISPPSMDASSVSDAQTYHRIIKFLHKKYGIIDHDLEAILDQARRILMSAKLREAHRAIKQREEMDEIVVDIRSTRKDVWTEAVVSTIQQALNRVNYEEPAFFKQEVHTTQNPHPLLPPYPKKDECIVDEAEDYVSALCKAFGIIQPIQANVSHPWRGTNRYCEMLINGPKEFLKYVKHRIDIEDALCDIDLEEAQRHIDRIKRAKAFHHIEQQGGEEMNNHVALNIRLTSMEDHLFKIVNYMASIENKLTNLIGVLDEKLNTKDYFCKSKTGIWKQDERRRRHEENGTQSEEAKVENGRPS